MFKMKHALALVLSLGSQVNAAEDKCSTAAVGKVLEAKLSTKWHQGTVRAWDEQGEFWSMPMATAPDKLAAILNKEFKENCEVFIADLASFSARILPKNNAKLSIEEIIKDAKRHPLKNTKDLVSKSGVTLGLFAPQKNELILIMYPAKIAAAIARGTGTALRSDLKDVIGRFPAELDIEYNFGGFAVRTFGGTGKISMREAADVVFSSLRKQGYTPSIGSEKAVAAFDGFFPPDRHESYWHKNDSIARIELEKLKNGQVRLNIHDDKDRSIGTKS